MISSLKRRFIPINHLSNERGVTLIEAMVYIAMAGMLLATAVTAFLGQNKSYNRQDVVAEIQQNIRGSRESVAADIRFAGMGLELNGASEKPFQIAELDYFAVNYWDDENDDVIRIHYRLSDNELQRAVTDKTVLNTPASPVLDNGTARAWQTVAENIEQLKFEYLFTNKNPPNLDFMQWASSASDIVDKAHASLGLDDAGAREAIQAVKVIVQGGARESAFNPTDPATYNPPFQSDTPANLGWISDPPPNTGYKQTVSFVVQARNNVE